MAKKASERMNVSPSTKAVLSETESVSAIPDSSTSEPLQSFKEPRVQDSGGGFGALISSDSDARARASSTIAWSVSTVGLLIAAVLVLHFVIPQNSGTYEPALLLPLLNTLFLFAPSLALAYVAGKSYMRSGSPPALMLGCGALALGLGALVGGWLMKPLGSNFSVAIFNISMLMAAIFHAAGLQRKVRVDSKGGRLVAISYLAVILLTAAVAWAVQTGVAPAFFIANKFPTPVRQIVLLLALLLLSFSSLVLIIRFVQRGSWFLYWYSLGLALLGVAAIALLFLPAVGTLMNWLGRIAQYLAGVYLFIAILSANRYAKSRGVALGDALTEALHGSGAYWQDILSTIGEVVISTDSNGIILLWNSAAEDLFGYTIEQTEGKSIGMILNIECSEGLVETVLRRSNGSTFDAEVTCSKTKLANEPISTYVIRDVTERKRVEETIRESEARFRAVFEQSGVGILICSPNGAMSSVNAAFLQMTGYSEQELLEISYDRITHPDDLDAEMSQIGQILTGAISSYQIDKRYICKDQQIIWARLTNAAVYRSDGEVAFAVGIVEDITQRRLFDQRQQELLEREKNIADTLQGAIVPPNVPTNIHGYELAVRYRPALREAEVGGDFYDVFKIDETKIGILIGDVAGKGLAAAIRVSAARHAVRAYAHVDPRPARVITLTNDTLCKDADEYESGMLTAFFAVVDVDAGVMYYTSAGHEPPIVRSADGVCEELEVGGIPLGLLEGTAYAQGSRRMDEGDLVVMVTDGITEARATGTVLWGKEGLTAYVQANSQMTLDELASGILQSATEHAEGLLQDDAAIVVFSHAKSHLDTSIQE